MRASASRPRAAPSTRTGSVGRTTGREGRAICARNSATGRPPAMACSAAVKSAAAGRLIRPSEAASTAQSAGGAVAIALVSASMA